VLVSRKHQRPLRPNATYALNLRAAEKARLPKSRRRQLMDYLQVARQVSMRRASGALRAERSSHHCRGKRADPVALEKRIKEIAQTRVRDGHRRIPKLLKRGGWPVLDPRFAFTAHDVVETLDRAGKGVGYPKTIRVDNGPEFVSCDLDLWAYRRGSPWTLAAREGEGQRPLKMRGLA